MKNVGGKNLNAKSGIILWVVIHAILIILGISVPWKMDSDLYSILPDSNEIKNVSAAEKTLSSRSMRNITVLVGHENFEVARKVAASLDSIFKGDSSIEESRLYVDEKTLNETREFLFEHRYTIQGEDVREAFFNLNHKFLELAALQKIYGSFSMANLNRLDEDPYLLGEASFDNFMKKTLTSSTHFSLRDGVLAAQDSGMTYVMWNAVLSENVSSLATDDHVIGRLNHVLDSLENANLGLRISASGVPFHSYESSSEAKREVAWISGVSIVLILLLLLYVFRSAVPILATLSTIAVAIFTALTFTWFVFGNVHVFTFVFGTSVIGVSIDYAVHFFTNWKSGVNNVRSKIFKGLLLGFLTTEVSYVALTFADFTLLRQMAVFSIVGLLSSFLTIILLFHAVFEKPRNVRTKNEAIAVKNLPLSVPKKFIKCYSNLPTWVIVLFFVFFAIALVPGLRALNIHTDLGSLYSMSDKLKAGEALNRKLNDIGISSNYFIVDGETEQDVLEQEELLTERLLQAEKKNLLKSHLAVSSFIPSQTTQRKTFENAQKLLNDDLTKEYLTSIGVQNDSLLDASLKEAPKYVGLEDLNQFPSSIRSMVEMLWVGAVENSQGKKFYSAVFPLHATDAFDAKQMAKNMPHVYVVNKMQNINESFTKISRVSLTLVGLAYIVMFIILVFVYKFTGALKILRAPVLASLFAASVFGYAGIEFNFFAIVGVILTLGIGIDYALFFREGGRQKSVTALAVMLSAATTLISFGGLVYSGFTPVWTFGLAVLLGISCCFVLSPLSAKR